MRTKITLMVCLKSLTKSKFRAALTQRIQQAVVRKTGYRSKVTVVYVFERRGYKKRKEDSREMHIDLFGFLDDYLASHRKGRTTGERDSLPPTMTRPHRMRNI